jgi:hypothetical protein
MIVFEFLKQSFPLRNATYAYGNAVQHFESENDVCRIADVVRRSFKDRFDAARDTILAC